MAQANSVQREPSMEEILASIRRIIEDNDVAPGAKEDAPEPQAPAADADSAPRPAANVAAAPPPPYEEAVGAEPIDDTGADIAELDSFRAEFDDPGAETAPESRGEPAPARLADVQAEVEARAAEADAAEALTATEAEEGAMSAPETADHDESASFIESVNKEPPAGYDDMPSFDHLSDAGTSAPVAAAGAADDAASAQGDAEATSGGEGDGMPSILSDVTGRRVAAAFDELSEAFEASRRKSFDEMAEEMLRPMLQDWLDNNLPTLVEKLVREEIERVARGGTR